MTRKPVTVTLTPSAEEALSGRFDRRYGVRDRSTAVSAIIDRYHTIMGRSCPELSEPEWNLLRDALNGVIMWDGPWGPASLEHQVEDAVKLDRLDEKWSVNGAELVQKLAALDYAGKVAVVDAVERWWIGSDK